MLYKFIAGPLGWAINTVVPFSLTGIYLVSYHIFQFSTFLTSHYLPGCPEIPCGSKKSPQISHGQLAISWQFPNIWHSSKAFPTINKEPCLQHFPLSSAGGPPLPSTPLLSSNTALCWPPSLPDVDKVKWKSPQFSATVQQATPEEENSAPILTIFHKLS